MSAPRTSPRPLLLLGLLALAPLACRVRPGEAPPPVAAQVESGLPPLRANRLEALVAELEGRVAASGASGAVMMLERAGRLELAATVGEPLALGGGPAGGSLVGEEVIFPIHSMTKPVVCLAAMQLVEEGRLALEDPVARHLEEWAAPRVAVLGLGGELEGTRPATRPVTVGDLLAHTSGLSYGFLEPGPLGDLYREARLDREFASNRERSRALAALPLAFEPGSEWRYGHSIDVVGALLEELEGERLDAILERRVLGPLGMRDTGFCVDPGSWGRVVCVVERDPGGARVCRPLAVPGDPPAAPDGGGGLYSTARDYLRFCELLLGRGEREGVRLVSEATFARMTLDRAAGLPRPRFLFDRGFGIGFALLTDESAAPLNGRVGGMHWSGIRGSSFFVDPEEQLCAVFLVLAGFQDFGPMTAFRKGVYAALPGYEPEPPKASGGSEVGE